MEYKTLITRNGEAPYDASAFSFSVVDGGALQITSAGGETDLIGPGFWVAVVGSDGRDRLDWDFLAAPSAPRAPVEAVRVVVEESGQR